MRRTFAATLCVCALMSAVHAVEIGASTKAKPADTPAKADVKPPPPAILRWNSGETITGEAIEASATDLTWNSPYFEDPLVLHWYALRRIDRALPASPIPEAFCFELRDGSVIAGEPTAFAEESIQVRSARHGDVTLKRSELLKIRRINQGGFSYAGPFGDTSWVLRPKRSNQGDQREKRAPEPSIIPPLTTGPGGNLMMPYWNGNAYLKVSLPDKVDIEFSVVSDRLPEFALSFGREGKERLTVETWGDDLVLSTSESFQLIRSLREDEREISLRLRWDRQAKNCTVYSQGGELLAEWKVPEDQASSEPGISLWNKGRNLTLRTLSVRAWSEVAVAKYDPANPRIELNNGRVLEGRVVSGAADAIVVRNAVGDGEEKIPLNEIANIVESTDVAKNDESDVRLSYADGTFLRGEMSSMRDGVVALNTRFTSDSLSAKLESLRQLLVRMPGPEGPWPEPDKIVVQQDTLSGQLSGVGDASLRWLPVGGVLPVRPKNSVASEVRRSFLPDAKLPSGSDLFYLRNGDVLSGRLKDVDAKFVALESDLTTLTKLPVDGLDAVQLRAVSRLNLQGFDDSRWRIVKGNAESVKIEGGALTMEPGTAFGHPAVMQCNDISFTMHPEFLSTIRMRLFSAGTEIGKSINLAIAMWGSEAYVGIESSDGQLGNQIRPSIDPDKPQLIRLAVTDRTVDLYLNGVLVRKFAAPMNVRAGSGLVLEPGSLWGNGARPIRLSDFSAQSVPGRTWLPEINGEAKAQALTVPRFRKERPPRHALLASNGDILRGEIEATTGTHFGFLSGLEKLRVPKDRVEAVIWLKKPTGEASLISPGKESKTEEILSREIRGTWGYSNSNLTTVISVIQREGSGLNIKLPEKNVSRRASITFGNQTIGEALEQICQTFGVRYTIAEDGSIVIEAGPPKAKGNVTKVYWLKSAAFSDVGSVRSYLIDKGLKFEAGAAVDWEAGLGQLSMTNTEQNQQALLKVIENGLGGLEGQPTHWLLLTSGARLGLNVEKFNPDRVIGRHPIYGACAVPISLIQTIRTTPPDENSTMRSLGHWSLAFAPEPVLPETGGQSSPILGKEAASFKLPMVGGGEFELAKEKGHVVVLDFWATWCGPCINSLPSLIAAMAEMPKEKVRFVGVNQGEPSDQVKSFLETRGWDLAVALDSTEAIGRQYGVDGIPYTVVVGTDGKIAWVKSGASPDGAAEIARVVKDLLAPPVAGSEGASKDSQ